MTKKLAYKKYVADLTPGAVEVLASLAKQAGDVYELGSKRPSHVWDRKTRRSLCGLAPRKTVQGRLLGTDVDLQAGQVCKKCLKAMARRIAKKGPL